MITERADEPTVERARQPWWVWVLVVASLFLPLLLADLLRRLVGGELDAGLFSSSQEAEDSSATYVTMDGTPPDLGDRLGMVWQIAFFGLASTVGVAALPPLALAVLVRTGTPVTAAARWLTGSAGATAAAALAVLAAQTLLAYVSTTPDSNGANWGWLGDTYQVLPVVSAYLTVALLLVASGWILLRPGSQHVVAVVDDESDEDVVGTDAPDGVAAAGPIPSEPVAEDAPAPAPEPDRREYDPADYHRPR